VSFPRVEDDVHNDDMVLWRMIGASGRVLECVVRFAPEGVEVAIRTDGNPTGTRHDFFIDRRRPLC